jgi:cytoskeletal protein CcmA (bactofilin family)
MREREMAKFWNKKPTAPEPPPEPERAPGPPPERRFTDRLEQVETVIARGIQIVGDVEGSDSVEVAGQVQGNVSTRGLCRVREGGTIEGHLNAGYAVIEGRLEGKIAVRRKAELGHAAHVEANIRAKGVAMAEGCFFEGRIHMQGGKARGSHHSFQEKRRRAR